MPKDFKTIDEQLKILIQRGLTVNNEEEAKTFLLRNNYYRVSGYSLTLRNHDVFYPHTTFRNIMDIYNFDSELRSLLFHVIESIEVDFKSVYAYFFCKQHGPLGYLNPAFFSSKTKYEAVMKKANEQLEKRLSHEAYLKHFVNELKEPIPFWAYIDLFTISDISIIYSISEPKIRSEVAEYYGLTVNNAPEILGSYMHCLTIVRNLCAHGSRLFNRLFITKPSLNKDERRLLNKLENNAPDNSRLFGYILNIRRMIPSQEFLSFKKQLLDLCEKYSFVNMKYYGFCDDWENIL